MTQLTKLFEPGRIGRMELKNRLVMAPMGTRTSDDEGFITQRTIDFYVARANGGVGLIISQTTPCVPEKVRTPDRAYLDDDKFIPSLSKLAEAVHAHGSKMAIQLVHYGVAAAPMRVSLEHPELIELVGPSAVPSVRFSETPREMSRQDIEFFVESFAEGARRVKDAGFDAVEIHGAHGYLISTFLSPRSNIRTDEYGGSPENRARFACEIISRARQKVGPDFPIIFRFSGSDFLEGGISIDDSVRQAPLFVQAGADALHVSSSVWDSSPWMFPCYIFPYGAITHLAQAVKRAVDVPVITVGKLGEPVVAERVLEEGKADFIAIGRGLLADPELPNKAREGRLDDICRCIYCNMCTTQNKLRVATGRMICSVNPELFREAEFPAKSTTSPKKVMVVGGGLAGMEAARTLAERGHEVTLYERSDKLGGQWSIACQEAGKENLASLITYLARGLDRAGVKVTMNKEVTPELVRELNPGAVVVATGGSPMTLNVPGANRENVVQAVDVITGKARVGDKVVVVGGRYVGMEVALSLARQGKKVSLITKNALGENGTPLERNTFLTLRQMLVDNGVFLYPYFPLLEIREDGVYVAQDNDLLFLKADTVVMAVGTKAENKLAEALEHAGHDVHRIGDCLEPRYVMYAIYEGREVGCQI